MANAMTGQASWLDQARDAHRRGDDAAKNSVLREAIRTLIATLTGLIPPDPIARPETQPADNRLLDKAGRRPGWLSKDGEIAERAAMPIHSHRPYSGERDPLTRIFFAIDSYSEQ